MLFSHQMHSHLFKIFQRLPTISFSFHSSSSSSPFHFLSTSSTSTFPLYKYFFPLSHLCTLIFPFHNLSSTTLFLSETLISMALKSKKSSYILFGNVFNLTRSNGAVRLNKPPSLTHRPHDHLSESARTGLVSFSSFFLIFEFFFDLSF